jgi:hypothetical protein
MKLGLCKVLRHLPNEMNTMGEFWLSNFPHFDEEEGGPWWRVLKFIHMKIMCFYFIIVQFVMSLNYKLGQLAFHPYSCLLCANEWPWLSYQWNIMSLNVWKDSHYLDLVMRNEEGKCIWEIVKLLSQVHS